MAAHPGNDIPSPSASEFIVVAVPIVLQNPGEVVASTTILMNSSSSISPVASNFLAFQTIVPDPALSPFQYPFIIGPDERQIEGISTVDAAISNAGVVLSQPIVSTTPSIG